MDVGDESTLCTVFAQTSRRYAKSVALRCHASDTVYTWDDYYRAVEGVAAGLAFHGVSPGDTVALMMTNRPEAFIVDTAAVHLGAVPFSIYNTSSQEQIDNLLQHAAPRVVVAESQFVSRVLQGCESTASSARIFQVDGAWRPDSLAELIALGEPGFRLSEAATAVRGDDVAALIYTSGTTGAPKGVEITHRNLVAWWAAASTALQLHHAGSVMSYLPMAHLGDRVLALYPAIFSGASVTCVPDARDLLPALKESRPTYWAGVPRIWEKLMIALRERDLTGVDVPALIGLDRAQAVLSSSAPLPTEILEFFAGHGITICETWGMTETTAIATVNPPGSVRFGTVGTAVPGTDVRLAADGELLVRGPVVMKGYRHDPQATADAFDGAGFLRTGDVGVIDDDGYVTIIDRKKSLIVNAAGKNMSPANIEQAVKTTCPLVGSVVAFGDRRPYVVALIALDTEQAAAFALEHGMPHTSVSYVARADETRAAVSAAIDRANARLSRPEQIKRAAIVAQEWLPGGDELTPTMKVRRRPIAVKYADTIERLYTERTEKVVS